METFTEREETLQPQRALERYFSRLAIGVATVGGFVGVLLMQRTQGMQVSSHKKEPAC